MDSEKTFFSLVYEVARLIPHGRVTTYGAIARYLGMARSARMVGWAMNNCHNQPGYVPAHRVVNRSGLLTGKNHFENPKKMEELLRDEGVRVENDRIVDFEKVFWDPEKELSI